MRLSVGFKIKGGRPKMAIAGKGVIKGKEALRVFLNYERGLSFRGLSFRGLNFRGLSFLGLNFRGLRS